MRTWQSYTRSQNRSTKAITASSRQTEERTSKAQRNIQQTPSMPNLQFRNRQCSFNRTTSKYMSSRRWSLRPDSLPIRRKWKEAGSRPSNQVSLHTEWDTSVASFTETLTPLAITQAPTRSPRSTSMSDSSKDRSSSRARRRPHTKLLELGHKLTSAKSR